jgi:hypothetical protein
VTSKTAEDLGWKVTAEASVHTWEGLVDALVAAVLAERASL